MLIKEFKRFVAEIPSEFDEQQLSWADFSYCDSLQAVLSDTGVSIGEWGTNEHVYRIGGSDPVKIIPVITKLT